MTKARSHLTTEGFFAEGCTVLSKNFICALEYKKDFYKYITRIADSYYTKIFKKSKKVITDIVSVFSFKIPDDKRISREVILLK